MTTSGASICHPAAKPINELAARLAGHGEMASGTPIGQPAAHLTDGPPSDSNHHHEQRHAHMIPDIPAKLNNTTTSSSSYISQQGQDRARRQPQVAPLASLDCSITEQYISNYTQAAATANSTSSTTTTTATDTPTLSGYFDCDQLSDMVDDSLFEITNAGCLSKSVFASSATVSAKTIAKSVAGSGRHKTPIVTSGANYYANPTNEIVDNEEGPATPTNGHSSVIQNSNYFSLAAEPTTTTTTTTATISAKSSAGQRDQQQQKVSGSLASNMRPAAKPIKSAARYDEPPAAGGQMAVGGSSAQLVGGEMSVKTPAVVRSRHRKSRSQQDFRENGTQVADGQWSSSHSDDDIETATATTTTMKNNRKLVESRGESKCHCSICGSKLKCLRVDSDSSTMAGKRSKTRKRMFSFSLFNLFSSTANQDSHKQVTTNTNTNTSHEHAQHRCSRQRHVSANSSAGGQPASHYNPKSSGGHGNEEKLIGNGTSVTSSSGVRIKARARRSRGNVTEPQDDFRSMSKARDSIKVTAQRKQRKSTVGQNNATLGAVPTRSSTVHSLLDDARPAYRHSAPSGAVRAAEPEVLLDLAVGQRKQVAQVNGGECYFSTAPSLPPRARATSQSSAMTKSATSGQLSGHGQQTRQTKSVKFTTPDRVMILAKRHTSSGHLPPSPSLQPSAPIIKRPVAKSSSHSQTESHKELDAMLLNYALNSGLVAQINEKLNLTETIASPRSALDESLDLDSDSDSNRLLPVAPASDRGDWPTVSHLNAEANSGPEGVAVGNCQDNADTEQEASQPTNGTIDNEQNSETTTRVRGKLEAEVDEKDQQAGFSHDWLDKQRASIPR